MRKYNPETDTHIAREAAREAYQTRQPWNWLLIVAAMEQRGVTTRGCTFEEYFPAIVAANETWEQEAIAACFN